MILDRTPFERKFNDIMKERQSWEPTWKEIQKNIYPTRGFFDDLPNQGTKIDHQSILANTPMKAAGLMASGLMSGLTSPARPWFKLGAADPELNDYQPVRIWLNNWQQLMMAVFSRSNIYHELHTVYLELVTFATAAMGIFPDYNKVVRGMTFTIGEYGYDIGPDGFVNTFARNFYMTPANMVSEFGLENVPDRVKNAYSRNESCWIKVYHLIEPNNDRIPGRIDNQNMPFRSVYWADGQEAGTVLRYGGFEEFPILGPRWGVRNTLDVYGRDAPGWHSLGDSKELQKLRKDKLIALDKIVDPALMVPVDLKNDPVYTYPGGLNYGDKPIMPLYQVNTNIQHIDASIQQTKEEIRETFFVDLFLMLATQDRPQMTAREIAERHEEKLLVLGPMLERLEYELLDPLIDRTFNIMLRAGLGPPPPREMQGMDLKVEYISLLAQAQKMVGVSSIEQTATFIGALAPTFPEVVDKFNYDKAVDEYAEMVGTSPEIIRSAEEVAAMRTERQKLQDQQLALQNASAAIQGAKTISEIDTGGNNALTALLGSVGGGE